MTLQEGRTVFFVQFSILFEIPSGAADLSVAMIILFSAAGMAADHWGLTVVFEVIGAAVMALTALSFFCDRAAFRHSEAMIAYQGDCDCSAIVVTVLYHEIQEYQVLGNHHPGEDIMLHWTEIHFVG